MPEELYDESPTAHLMIKQGTQVGKRLELWKNVTTIGRSRECDIFLEDLAVHRKQASIIRTTQGYMLHDDHGSGDSFVNEQAVSSQILTDGDILCFGNTMLAFSGHEGTRPFQLASSRGQELKWLKQSPSDSGIYSSFMAKLDLSGPNGRNGSFELNNTEIAIGRSRECTIFLEDLAVSRVHAIIRQLPGGIYEIEDQSSATGTFVNGALIARHHLTTGDLIQIGSNNLVFRQISR